MFDKIKTSILLYSYVEMLYSVATNRKNELIDFYVNLNKKYDDEIFQVFASKAFSVLGSANADVPNISDKQIAQKIQYAKDKGIKFNYLINSNIIPNVNDEKSFKEMLKYLERVNSLPIDIVTIANKNLLEIMAKNFPELPVNISIVSGVKEISTVNELRKKYKNITRITLNQSLNRDKLHLIQHIKNAHHKEKGLNPIQIELLANEICFLNCPNMDEHYKFLSALSQSKKPIDFDCTWCGKERGNDVLNFMNSTRIRPEDIKLYDDVGVDIIKLAGRKEPSENLKLRVKAYMERKYEGNVMDLFLKEFWIYHKPPYINNRELDGFIEYLWENNLTKIDKLTDHEKYANIKYHEKKE